MNHEAGNGELGYEAGEVGCVDFVWDDLAPPIIFGLRTDRHRRLDANIRNLSHKLSGSGTTSWNTPLLSGTKKIIYIVAVFVCLYVVCR